MFRSAMGRALASFGLAFILLGPLSHAVFAQKAWPTRPLTLVVPGGAGSSTDNIARPYADRLSALLGQPVVVDNKTGGEGTIGSRLVARAKPDGYTLLIAGNSILVLNAFTLKDPPYDIEKDFAAVGQIASIPFGLVASADFPARTVPELIAAAKGKETFFATPGAASISRLIGEWLGQKTGIKLINVPYPASPPAHADVIAGRVPLMIDGLGGVAPHVKSGRLRLLAVSTKTRANAFPDTPTIAEAIPGFVVPGVFAILAPAGTPPEILAILNRETRNAVKAPLVIDRYAILGAEAVSGPPAELDEILKEQRVLFKALAEQARLRPE